MMTITQTKTDNALTVRLSGRLDTMTAPELESFLKDNLDGVTALTIDLQDLEYMSSAGLRVMLSAQKRMNAQGDMQVCHVNETIAEIFEVTGFNDILTVV